MNLNDAVVSHLYGTPGNRESRTTVMLDVTIGPDDVAVQLVSPQVTLHLVTLHLEKHEATRLAVKLLGPAPLETLRRLYDVSLASSLTAHAGDQPLSDEEMEGLRRTYEATPDRLNGMARRLVVTILKLRKEAR